MGAQAVRLSNVDIDNALKDKDFEVLFQPIFDLGNGALARVETFIRWRHPSLGVLPPGAFISFFESQGRMSELTRYVLAEALAAYEAWRGAHPPGFSINLALTDLADEAFASHFTVLLRERNFPAELITLECPMPPVEADIETTALQLQRLADTGARLAIEVRGRANDFLKTLRPFPFAEIKTGGAAILRFARTVRGPGLSAISELLELAAEQNAAITAVGVEDQASLSALRGLGFAAAQGNHLAKVGSLNQFMPSHVNDVRTLLGLEPLSSADLAALFRTGGPALSPAPASSARVSEGDEPDGAAIIEDAIEEEIAETPAKPARGGASTSSNPATSDDELVERLARRLARQEPAQADESDDPQTEESAKAAAIARARRKSMMRKKLAAKNALADKAKSQGDHAAARDMQERLSREFGAFAAADENDAAQDEPAQPQAFAADPIDAAPQDFAPESAAEPDDVAEAVSAPQEAVQPPKAAKPFDARMAVKGAKARFTPTIRVSNPELDPPEEIGDLGSLEQGEEPAPHLEIREPSSVPDAADEDPIPEPMSNAQWLEETVAVEAAQSEETDDATPTKKNFLTRKYDITPKYSGYFWPRAMRKWMKRRRREKTAAQAAE
ncbi:MAG: EAL domain-containing protein [Parvularculaceae bacterium]